MRVPRHSVESEQALLGGLLLEADAIYRVGPLQADEFYRHDHRLIFRVISRLVAEGRPADVVTVAEALESNGELERAGGLPYIASLAEHTPSAANVSAYAERVREHARIRTSERALQDALGELAEPGERKAAEIVADLQLRLDSVQRGAAGASRTLSEAIELGLREAAIASKRRRAGGLAGAPTGIAAIDDRTGGLHGPRLWIVAARTSVGKTALTLQWALHAASAGYPVGVCSLEMGPGEIALRAIANRLGMNATRLALGDPAEFESLKAFAADGGLAPIRGLRLLIDTETATLPGIVSRISEWRRVHGIRFAIVDHVGLIEGAAEGFRTRTEQLGHVSRTLKKLSKRLDMPIVAVSQLNRNVEREARRPCLADLRDSGNLEQDADVVVMLHPQGDSGVLRLGVLKNRAGRTGWIRDKGLRFDGRTQSFLEEPIADEAIDE